MGSAAEGRAPRDREAVMGPVGLVGGGDDDAARHGCGGMPRARSRCRECSSRRLTPASGLRPRRSSARRDGTPSVTSYSLNARSIRLASQISPLTTLTRCLGALERERRHGHRIALQHCRPRPCSSSALTSQLPSRPYAPVTNTEWPVIERAPVTGLADPRVRCRAVAPRRPERGVDPSRTDTRHGQSNPSLLWRASSRRRA